MGMQLATLGVVYCLLLYISRLLYPDPERLGRHSHREHGNDI